MSIASKDLFVVVSIVVPVLGGIFYTKGVDISFSFCYIRNMTKEEFIAKYGEEAWNRKLEQSKLWCNQKYANDPEYREKRKERSRINIAKWKKSHRESENAANLKRHNERYKTDSAYREHMRERTKNHRLKFMADMGDTGAFVTSQLNIISREQIEDLDKYIMENLVREASEVDGDPRLISEDYLYDCFVENCRYGLFYGNLQVIKYFVPLMCVKAHRNIEFTDKNIEMIKVFDEYRNTLHKKPIEYSFKMYYIRPDQKSDIDMNTKCMLLYNLSADFMHNRSRYQTEKKLY